MKQIELARELGVSKAYISMVMRGKKKPSKQITTQLKRMGIVVNSLVNFEAKSNPKSCSSANSDTPPMGNHLIQ